MQGFYSTLSITNEIFINAQFLFFQPNGFIITAFLISLFLWLFTCCALCPCDCRELGSIVSLVVVIVSKCLGTFFIVYRNMCFGGFSNPVDFYFNHCIINIQFILFCLLYHRGTTFVQNNCRFGRVICVWWNDASTRHTSLVSVWNGPMYRYVIITSD